MGVYLSAPAEADLNRIFDYIREQSPQNAAAFLVRVESVVESLGQFPRANRVRRELPVADLRFGRADPALLIYRVLDNGDCEILRVAHKSQHIPALFEFDDPD